MNLTHSASDEAVVDRGRDAHRGNRRCARRELHRHLDRQHVGGLPDSLCRPRDRSQSAPLVATAVPRAGLVDRRRRHGRIDHRPAARLTSQSPVRATPWIGRHAVAVSTPTVLVSSSGLG